ncbi:MAG TPA: Asp-tRNA(Asn)/Glu-tRNA(Gln) amidotransferase subunit GatC [Nitrospirae bacterium]|nr:Asp-tRNA(Asn)/Glu-tRNA(Gln) amidotransferase subunit GatC [Nitrospirota bacterium]
MKISAGDVEHIARLARLGLNDEEKRMYGAQLNEILDYVDKLNELDTAGVEPTSHVIPIKNVFRRDVPGTSLPREEALGNAPQAADGFYRVPKIID